MVAVSGRRRARLCPHPRGSCGDFTSRGGAALEAVVLDGVDVLLNVGPEVLHQRRDAMVGYERDMASASSGKTSGERADVSARCPRSAGGGGDSTREAAA